MLAASVPIYVCATGSIPIAAVLMMKGLSPGAALVFLMAGPATNTATMAVISKAIDRKTLIQYMAIIIGSALLFGILTNQFLPREWFTGMISEHGVHDHSLLPEWLKITSAILLGLAIINVYFKKFIRNKNEETIVPMAENIKQMKLTVTGMTCNHCKMNVERNIRSLEGIKFVEAFPDKNEVIVQGDELNLDSLKQSVESIGYGFEGEKV